MGYERPLLDIESVEHFVKACLPDQAKFSDSAGNAITANQIVNRVESAEKLFQAENAGSTYQDKHYRVEEYRLEPARKRLREQIVKELFSLARLHDDEKIALGSGGAKPNTAVKTEKQAYLLTGLPASGKSGIAAKVCDEYGAYLVDPDFAKRKLPEFEGLAGATRVHQESMQIALGSLDAEAPNLLSACIASGANLVRPLIGDESKKLDAFRDILHLNGYQVHLCLIELDRAEATRRALNRFLQTGRYVSLGYIFDDCANDAALVYYKYRVGAIVEPIKSNWASLGAISTTGNHPAGIDFYGSGSPAELFQVQP
jgi:hypothetical protein